jgi:hypothetical protein
LDKNGQLKVVYHMTFGKHDEASCCLVISRTTAALSEPHGFE